MITIYHLSTSRSERIVWLVEELGLEYKLEVFQREPNGAAPRPMKELHALGKAPMIRDGDTLLAESGAIVEYIVQRHGGGRLAVQPQAPEASESPIWTRTLDRLKQMLAFVDAELLGRPYFAGAEFTAADVMMVFPFTTMRHFLDYDIAPYANILAYMKRIEARPAYRKAMALAR